MLTPLRYGMMAVLLCTVGVMAHAQTRQRITQTQVPQQADSALAIDPQTLNSLISGAFGGGAGTSLVVMGENGDTLEHIENGDTLVNRGDANGMLRRFFGGAGFSMRGSATAMGHATVPIDRSAITLTPAVRTVSAQNRTATFRVTNPSNDSIPLDFILQSANPHTLPLLTHGGSRGTVDTKWSLAGWINDVPSGVVLAPHESRTVTMHLTVPESAAAGEYSAYVVLYYAKPITINESTDLSGGLDFLSDTTAHGFPSNSYVLGRVVYVKKP